MPTFNDPKADAAEAYEALRGLAHATRPFENSADTYGVLGDLLGGMRSLIQVADQLAGAHRSARHRAFIDGGDQTAGVAAADEAGRELLAFKALLDQAHDRLDAAMSHSGQIAWHPESQPSPLGQFREADAPRTVEEVGTLKLTVWPITPLGVHHRYGYLIEDQATGNVAGGRDLFTGTEPVTPDQAIRQLVIDLQAEGGNRQHAIDHPGEAAPKLMFPEQIADAAHANDAALSARASALTPRTAPLVEPLPTPAGELAEVPGSGRWISVVFFQGEEAGQALAMLDRDGSDALIEYLAGYDVGDDTVQAALANGYVYDEPPNGPLDRTATRDVYTLTYNHDFGYVSLLREYDAIPDPALLGIDTPPTVEPGLETISEPQPAGKDRSASSWFGRSGSSRAPSQGLAL